MVFTQSSFLFVFLPISIIIYLVIYKISKKNLEVCNIVLVLEGLFFLWWAEPKLLLFFVVLTVLLYLIGNRIYTARTNGEKKQLMIVMVIVLAVLSVTYKYLPSLMLQTEEESLSYSTIFSEILVPFGMCFLVLEAISYIADIYEGKAIPGNIFDVFVFMMLFPKAACGPIALWKDFRPQIHNRKTKLDSIIRGLKRIIVGYAKKSLLADTFASSIILIETKMTTNSIDSTSVWLLELLYFFRIYYDFSGYSDIAIGLCNIFGFDIVENFNKPYLSESVTEFWRRWHISLGRWLREYVYIPLGGNISGMQYINIMVTFVVAGLWHGWRLPVLIWATLNGLIVVAEKEVCKRAWHQNIPRRFRVVITMIFIYFGWILFRAPNMIAVKKVFKALFIPLGGSVPNFTWSFFMTRRIAAFLLIAVLETSGIFGRMICFVRTRIDDSICEIVEGIALLVLFAISIVFVIGTDTIPFIYFNL